jgi:UDP-N-acetylglucosamine:LPS N-acetylglucosamine transferase
MTRRILIPYLKAGLGHLVQAQAIAGFLRRTRPEWDVRLMDIAAELDDPLLQRTFVDLWKVFLKMPGPLATALFGLERLVPGVVRALNRRSFRTSVPKAAAWLQRNPPDLIMATHWACSHLFAMARGTARIPIFYLYGELDTIYSIADCGADRYFALTEKTAEGLAGLGIDRRIIRQIPLVVDPSMVATDVPREVLRRGLGVPADGLAVVLSLGGEGIGRTLPFVKAFARSAKGATLIVLTGKNADLLDLVRRQVHSPAVIPLGYQEDLSPIVASADVLAGKCGTGFASMAVTTGIPLLVTHLGAPNERGNMRFIVGHGHGWYCPHPAAFTRKIAEIVKERSTCPDGAPPRRRRQALNGAQAIAQEIVEALA